MKNFLFWVMASLCPLMIVSCSDKENDNPEFPTSDVGESIVGTWLLSSSDAENWVSYEITETSRVNAEIARDGYYGIGTGYYSVENNKFSGSYTTDRSQTFYLDWVITDIKPFEIAIEIYDDNILAGDASIYRVLSTIELEADNSIVPDYRRFCGTDNFTNFSILDGNIAKIDKNTGEISALAEGITFATFSTPNGIAAVKIVVDGKIKTFKELLVGTWVYDSPAEKTWERYTYADNGYVYVQWATYDGVYNLDESSQGMYTIDEQTVSFSLPIPQGQLNMRMVTESINDFDWTYTAYDGSSMVGKYTSHRMLESVALSPKGTANPNYQTLVGSAQIQSYKAHDEKVAKVSDNGEITALAKGRTYIDVKTNKGTGVIEVIVDGGAIPVAFEDCIGQPASKVHELLGSEPYLEDDEVIVYRNFTSFIDQIGVSLDSMTGLVAGVLVTYNSSVKTADVTSILDATFIPFMSQTTDTFKAYMNAANREDATVGVTWDITSLTLTYVNLATDLFTDYSVLIGMDKSKVLKKMGRQPDVSDDQSQSWFFFDNKGIKIVSAYYTDFVNMFDDVHSVVTMFDDTLSVEEITKYLKKKYPYYPEYSSETELVFVPAGHAMEIYYRPEDKMIMYISTSSVTKSKTSCRQAAKQLRSRSKAVKR